MISNEHDHGERTETRAAVKQLSLLAGVLAIAIAASIETHKVAMLLIIVALIGMLLAHELGHFIVAKRSGMKVTEFMLGFGPTLWSVRKGETSYGIKAIPAGAYVRIIGMNSLETVPEEDEARTYRQKPFHSRFGVAIAGSAMHMLMAFGIYLFLLTVVGLPAASTTIGSISALKDGPSPAQDAGFQTGDKVVAVDGHKVHSWEKDVPPNIRNNAGKPLTFTIERNGKRQDLIAVPVDRRAKPALTDTVGTNGEQPFGFVGIGPKEYGKKEPIFGAIAMSGKQVGVGCVRVVKGVGRLFAPSGIKSYSAQVAGTSTETPQEQVKTRPISVVGIVDVGTQAAHAGLRDALMFLFAINLALGVFNMLPTSPLDGGHAVVAIIEKVKSRNGRRYVMDPRKLAPFTIAAIAILGVFSLSALYLDITHPLSSLLKQ